MSAKLRIAASKALREHEGIFGHHDAERFPHLLTIPRGVVVLVEIEPVPDWGARFDPGGNLRTEDGLALERQLIRDALDVEAFGNWVEDPIAGGLDGLAWAMTLSPKGNLFQARVTTLLHLAHKRNLEHEGRIYVPRRAVWAPYAPDKDHKLDLRKLPEVEKALASIKPLEAKASA